MRFCSRDDIRPVFEGKSVAIVGSGPGCLENHPGLVDSHDVVARVNNYRLTETTGYRTDVFYSFHGNSIKKAADELKLDGVSLVMCKCPNAKFMESRWHEENNKPHGVDFRYIYKNRERWWFCDTYVPDTYEFLTCFNLLQQHIPSTGFSALWTIASFNPKSIYLTGFDFFASLIHNVNEPWRPGNPDDPIGHAPELEREWVARHKENVSFDATLTRIME